MSRSAEGLDDLSDHVAGNLVAEVERLRAEVAELRALVEAVQFALRGDGVLSDFMLSFGTVREVAELRADRERLEWLEGLTRGVKIELAGTDHGQYVVIETDIDRPRSVSRTTLRAAIDAAKGKP